MVTYVTKLITLKLQVGLKKHRFVGILILLSEKDVKERYSFWNCIELVVTFIKFSIKCWTSLLLFIRLHSS